MTFVQTLFSSHHCMLQGTSDRTECSVRWFRINPCEICFVKYIFEGYDGLAVLSTVDAVSGIVTLSVGPGREQEADRVLDDLGCQIRIEALSDPARKESPIHA